MVFTIWSLRLFSEQSIFRLSYIRQIFRDFISDIFTRLSYVVLIRKLILPGKISSKKYFQRNYVETKCVLKKYFLPTSGADSAFDGILH